MIFQKGFHADVGEGSVKSFHSLARISSLDDLKCFDLNTGIMFQVIEGHWNRPRNVLPFCLCLVHLLRV